jgi:AraC family transcriptional regulator
VTGLHFLRADSGESVPNALERSTIVASSRGLGWDGVVAEMGCVLDWQADDLTVAGHFIAMNMDSKPLVIEDKGARGFGHIVMPPESVWVNPARRSFTRRNPGVTRWGGVEISVDRMGRALGRDVELRFACGVVDEQLAALVRALLLEAETAGSSGPMFAEGLGIAIASRLATQFGVRTEVTAPHGSLEGRLKRVLARIEDTLAEPTTVDDLAVVAGLSPAHFAREFKRCTKQTPHQFVMNRRLQRARQMLAAGGSIAETAIACGFSDQPHLCRLFKSRFGITPGAFLRKVRPIN